MSPYTFPSPLSFLAPSPSLIPTTTTTPSSSSSSPSSFNHTSQFSPTPHLIDRSPPLRAYNKQKELARDGHCHGIRRGEEDCWKGQEKESRFERRRGSAFGLGLGLGLGISGNSIGLLIRRRSEGGIPSSSSSSYVQLINDDDHNHEDEEDIDPAKQQRNQDPSQDRLEDWQILDLDPTNSPTEDQLPSFSIWGNEFGGIYEDSHSPPFNQVKSKSIHSLTPTPTPTTVLSEPAQAQTTATSSPPPFTTLTTRHKRKQKQPLRLSIPTLPSFRIDTTTALSTPLSKRFSWNSSPSSITGTRPNTPKSGAVVGDISSENSRSSSSNEGVDIDRRIIIEESETVVKSTEEECQPGKGFPTVDEDDDESFNDLFPSFPPSITTSVSTSSPPLTQPLYTTMIRPTTTTTTRPRGNSATSPAPSHIALPPPPSPLLFSRSRSRPSTPTSPAAGGGANNNNGDYMNAGSGQTGTPTSPRGGFLSNLMSKTRPRGSTLSRGSTNNVPTFGSGSGGQDSADGQHGGVGRSGSANAGGGGGGGRARGEEGGGGLMDIAGGEGGGGAAAGPSRSVVPPTEPNPTFRIRLVPHLESYRSLHFDPVVRDLAPCPAGANHPSAHSPGPGTVLKIGRFTEKVSHSAAASARAPPPRVAPVPVPQPIGDGATGMVGIMEVEDVAPSMLMGEDSDSRAGPVVPPVTTSERAGAGGGGNLTSSKVAFKSKVVSRGHAEIWCEGEGKFFIRDSKSSSGTFLNHIRLSNPNQESRPFSIKDGDVIQLGVDYQGGTEEMYRCVKMKVEVGRERQRGQQNNFNKEAMKQLKALGGVPESPAQSAATPSKGKAMGKVSVTDCCICLFSVTVQQALFIAPCSHVFHYKCIRPLLQAHHPGFSCPLCRSFHDLEADVETEDAWEVASKRHSVVSRRGSAAAVGNAGLALTSGDEPIPPVPALPSTTARSRNNSVHDPDDMDVDDTANNEPDGGGAVGAIEDPANPMLDIHHTNEAGVSSSLERAEDQLPEEEEEDEEEDTGPQRGGAGYLSPSASRPIMSLGALPVPLGRPNLDHLNSDYASLDAATPMNNTFLSTLAENGGLFSGGGVATNSGHGHVADGSANSGGSGDGSNTRRMSLDQVVEGNEMEMDAENVETGESGFTAEAAAMNGSGTH